jgi:nicotinamide riboside transporter PnuC
MVIAKASRTGSCKRLNSNDISVGIIGMRGNSTSSPLNFPLKIVASMILFIIFFTGHLVTGHLVINLFGHAHYNYAKFHYNHHRVQLITWSLRHLENFPFKIVASMILFIIFFTGHVVTWSLSHLVTESLGHLVSWSLYGLVPLWPLWPYGL